MAAVLAFDVAICEWLDRHTPARHLGTALMVIVLAAIQANLGLIPTYGGNDGGIYDAIFGYVGPLSIFWLLLQVDLRRVLRAGWRMLVLFLIAAAGTMTGAIVGMMVVDGPTAFGDFHGPLAGMFTGTYVGGSLNFNTIAMAYDVRSEAILFAGANAVDASMTTVWMIVCVAIPRLLDRFSPARAAQTAAALVEVESEQDSVRPVDLAMLFGAGLLAMWVSDELAARSLAAFGREVPSILILTSIALILAQTSFARRFQGGRVLGLFAVYIFLAVIGALCDIEAVVGLGQIALDLTLLVTVIFLIHGAFVFGGAALFKIDFATAAVASQAGVGGGTSALALAKSLGRGDLVLPGILVGSLGTALGTYLGMTVVNLI